MIRLYIDVPFRAGVELKIPDNEWKYFSSVRRGAGEAVLFNRRSQEAVGIIEKRNFRIKAVRDVTTPTYRLTVCVGLPENAVIPSIIRALSELGAIKLIFFAAKRSQSNAKRIKDVARFERLAIEAARQCGRGVPLEIETAGELAALATRFDSNVFFFDESSHRKSKVTSEKLIEAWLLLGPEGGWTEEERDLAKSSGWSVVHFETPILRAETAATAATFYALQRMNPIQVSY